MKADIKNIQFFEGTPDRSDLESWRSSGEHCVVILDDLMAKCSASQDISELFTTFSHHMDISVIFIVQNLFSAGKQFRTISLNAHYFVLFKNKRDELQVQTFARQICPGNVKYFMSAYKLATSPIHGSLLVDLSPNADPQYMLRSRILPGETTIVYAPA
ncbi:MAG: hypothetical protein ABW168_10155 [Sedimenticola sp.]